MSSSQKLFVVAIDFGTTYSGFAFSSKHEYEKDPTKINIHTWTGANSLVSHKTPTVLLLNEEKEFLAFGYEAENEYGNYAAEGLHENLYYFHRFKMLLYQKNKKLDKNCMLEDISGKKLPAMTVFSESIKFLKNYFTKMCDDRGFTLQASDIEWVLTVPAIWDDAAKQFMREAAEEAGIPDEYLRIALEPEAASMFCKYIPLATNRDGSNVSLATFQPGDKYMVLDAGGGTVDITFHQVEKDGSLTELHHASGGHWGGTQVDEEFKQFLVKLVGYPVLKKFCDSSTSDYVDMFRDFETKKRLFNTHEQKRVNFRIPTKLLEIFEEISGEDLKSVLKTTSYKKDISVGQDKIKIAFSIFEDFFNKPTSLTIDHVRELLDEPCCKGVNKVLMVGGFSACSVFQEKVRHTFPDMQVCIPEDADLVVLKGAVIFGHNSKVIKSRKAKHNYGIGTHREFRFNDPEEKKVHMQGKDYCKDVFDEHVKKGTELKTDDFQSSENYVPLVPGQNHMEIFVYECDKNEAFIDNCYKIGSFKVDFPDNVNDRTVNVQFKFSGTEMYIEGTVKSGKKTIYKLNCFD